MSYEVDIVTPKQLLARQLLSTSTLLTLKLYKQSFFVRHKVLFKSKSGLILFEIVSIFELFSFIVESDSYYFLLK